MNRPFQGTASKKRKLEDGELHGTKEAFGLSTSLPWVRIFELLSFWMVSMNKIEPKKVFFVLTFQKKKLSLIAAGEWIKKNKKSLVQAHFLQAIFALFSTVLFKSKLKSRTELLIFPTMKIVLFAPAFVFDGVESDNLNSLFTFSRSY